MSKLLIILSSWTLKFWELNCVILTHHKNKTSNCLIIIFILTSSIELINIFFFYDSGCQFRIYEWYWTQCHYAGWTRRRRFKYNIWWWIQLNNNNFLLHFKQFHVKRNIDEWFFILKIIILKSLSLYLNNCLKYIFLNISFQTCFLK